MRILADGLVYYSNGRGGIARYWSETIRAFNRFAVPDRMDLIIPGGSNIIPPVPHAVERSWQAKWFMLGADIFHSSYYRAWPSLRNIPLVTTVYDWVTADLLHYSSCGASSYGPGFVEMQKKCISKSAGIIAISEDVKRRTMEITHFPEDRIEVAHLATGGAFAQDLPSGFEIKSFRYEHTGGAPYFLHVGRKKSYKNFRTILEGYLSIAHKTDCHLLVVGGEDALTDDLAYEIYRAHAENKVNILPHVSDDELRVAYAASEAFLSASLEEGFGLPLLEALVSGARPILSDIPVYHEVAGDMAEYLPPSDPEAWADAMLREHTWIPEYRSRVLEKYSWEKTAEAHRRLYRKLLDK